MTAATAGARTTGDRGVIGVSMMLLVTVTLGGAALIVDGGRALAARRHAAGVAEAAAREAVSAQSLALGFDPDAAVRVARSFAERSGIAPSDITVRIGTAPSGAPEVEVTIVERRRTVFLVLGAVDEMTVRATGSSIVVWSS